MQWLHELSGVAPGMWVAIAASVVFVAALVGAARALLRQPDPVIERLVRPGSSGLDYVPQRLGEVKLEDASGSNLELRRLLVQAGVRTRRAPQAFLFSKGLLALTLPIVFIAINVRLAKPVDMALLIAVVLAVLGFLLPDIWLRGRIRRRRTDIERALPDALDLLVTCVEAGLGLDAALERVGREVSLSSPVLGGELRMTFLEIGAGLPRAEAFKRLASRTGVEDLRSLAATLTQAETFGTSVGGALRMRAEWSRTRRMQAAEERAAVVSVKMTIPLVLCILPSLIAVIMGPAAVRIIETLFTHLGGPK